MRGDLEQRAAELAVSRFGADADQVQQACSVVRDALAQGLPDDLLERLVQVRQLTLPQADELRLALDQTHVDLSSPLADEAGLPKELQRTQPTPVPAVVSANGAISAEPLQRLGEYRLLRKLGEGGMGEVFLAYQESAQRQVALKVLSPQLAANPALVERFEREARHASRLDHPNIVRGYGVGFDGESERRYLVMEFVDGLSAQALLDKHGRIEIGDAIHIALDIARALEHAHSRNIIHRDIKPENILISKSGVAKLADLGLAKQTDQSSHLTGTRQGFGTPYYMPYEQAINARKADHRSDIYSLGATLYHLVTGHVPFKGKNQMEILEKKEAGQYPFASFHNPKVTTELDRILDKMLARDPRERYQTASELIVDLDRSKLGVPVLSFVDHDLAMQDPLVRSRVASPVQHTQMDIRHSQRKEADEAPHVWYVRYHNSAGKACKVRASTDQVLHRIHQGSFNGTTQASHARSGRFQPLSEWPEFQEAMTETAKKAAAEPAEAPATGSWLLPVSVLLILAVIVGGLLYFILP